MRQRRRQKRFTQQTKCRFCRLGVKHLDHKDIATLQKLTTAQGKLFSRKRSGNCSKHQRSCREAVKRARFVALLPYVG